MKTIHLIVALYLLPIINFAQDEDAPSKMNIIPQLGVSFLLDKTYDEQPANHLASYSKINSAGNFGIQYYFNSHWGLALELGSLNLVGAQNQSKSDDNFKNSVENFHANKDYLDRYQNPNTKDYYFALNIAPTYRYTIKRFQLNAKLGVGFISYAQNSTSYLLKEMGSNVYDSVVVNGKKDIVGWQVTPGIALNYRLGRRILLGLHANYTIAFAKRNYSYVQTNLIDYSQTTTNTTITKPLQYFSLLVGLTIEIGKVK